MIQFICIFIETKDLHTRVKFHVKGNPEMTLAEIKSFFFLGMN